MPASSSASARMRPAGPTNGRPARSSSFPGCSPTNITSASAAPSPKTVCVPLFQSSHARQPLAATRSLGSVGRGGTGALLMTASLNGPGHEHGHHHHHEEDKQEDPREHLGDGKGGARNRRKTEHGGNQADHKKDERALQHCCPPRGKPARRAPKNNGSLRHSAAFLRTARWRYGHATESKRVGSESAGRQPVAATR